MPARARSRDRAHRGVAAAGRAPALLALLALGGGAGCAALRPAALPPPPRAAVALHALGEERTSAGDAAAAARAYEDAAAIAPGWVPPLRALDDLERAALRGPLVLERRRAELRARPGDPSALYLLGRLEGQAGAQRFRRAVLVDRRAPWPHHGLATLAFLEGDVGAARRHGAEALRRARDPHSRASFSIALARYALAAEEPADARGVLEARLAEPDLLATDRASVEAWLARAELETRERALVERGLRRAVRLLATAEPRPSEIAMLVASALAAAPAEERERVGSELAAALGAREGAGRDLLRAGLYLESSTPALGIALARRADALLAGGALDLVDPRLARAGRFATGEGPEAVEEWLARLPRGVVAADGLPRDPRLRELVLAARAGDEPRLAEALLDAGWFEEAHALAGVLATRDLRLALDVEARATAARALLDAIGRLLGVIDRDEPYGGPFASASPPASPPGSVPAPEPLAPLGPPRRIHGLGELLLALQPLFATYRASLPGGDELPPPRLFASPVAGYGPVGAVVHPGPTFSTADEERGLGTVGAPVPGLAEELDRLGRFGLFGEALGAGGPDGTVLRRLLVERRAGVHLGVPWSGSVAWCEGADVPSRPGRLGASIAGAALHEGYWIDVEALRADLARWRALEALHFADGEPDEVARAALAVRGLPLDPARPDPGRLVPVLGEGDRLRLAVLAERLAARAAGAREGPAIDLEELVAVTMLHEEGHLCDRTRFLPLSRHVLGALRLAFEAGLTPERIARRLEYRAQLVALCEAPDPRVPLADCLDAAESGLSATPHAPAYAALVADLLDALARRAARDPEALPALDRGRHFAHQLHRLPPEDVRRAALDLAGRSGMVVR